MDKGQLVATAVLSAAAFIKAIPHTIGIWKYQEILQFYNGTEPHALDGNTKELVELCLYKIDLSPNLEAGLETFVCYGQDVLHKGTLHMKTGAIVGLPFHFRYQQASDIDFDRLTLKNKSIEWDSEQGQKFADSLILSDNAKKFAIAHEVYYTMDQHIAWDGGLLMLNLGAAYCGHFALTELYQLKKRAGIASRMGLLGALGTVALGTYSFMSDVYQRRRDRRVIVKTSRLGNEFIEGGVEYFGKLLQRNSALYHLLGENGRKLYTLSGNQKISFRMKNLPLTSQRDMLKEMLPKTAES